MSLIILYATHEHIKPGTAEIRKSLMAYLRRPPPAVDSQTALDEVLRWRRAQVLASTMNIERLSPSEHLESFLGIVKPLRRDHKVFDTIFNNLQADVQCNDPDDEFVKENEERIVSFLKMMRASAGTQGQQQPAEPVPQAMAFSSQPSGATQGTTTQERKREASAEEIKEILEGQAKNLAQTMNQREEKMISSLKMKCKTSWIKHKNRFNPLRGHLKHR